MREVHAAQPTVEDKRLEQLSQTMERMALQLEELEGQLREDRYKLSDASSNSTQKQAIYRGARARRHKLCFLCGQEGHFRRDCLLNDNVPARMVPGGWHEKH